MEDRTINTLDEIDRELVRLLSENPRKSYKKLAKQLNESGYEMTAEGVRYRVQRLLDYTSVFFMVEPAEHGWEIVRFGIKVANEPGAIDQVYSKIEDTSIWLVCIGYGSYDLWAIGTVADNEQIRGLLSAINELEYVEETDYFVETGRRIDLRNYL